MMPNYKTPLICLQLVFSCDKLTINAIHQLFILIVPSCEAVHCIGSVQGQIGHISIGVLVTGGGSVKIVVVHGSKRGVLAVQLKFSIVCNGKIIKMEENNRPKLVISCVNYAHLVVPKLDLLGQTLMNPISNDVFYSV